MSNLSNPPPFTPENPLEASLMRAATDASHRPAFLHEFLAAPIFFIQEGPPDPAPAAAPRTPRPGEEIKIASVSYQNQPHLPFFTSLAQLQRFSPQPCAPRQLPASDFLHLTRGASLVLNPGAPYGKQFTPSEIASLLDGFFFQPQHTEVTLPSSAKVLLAYPARFPTDFVNAVSKRFAELPAVKAAYLAIISNTADAQPPHTLLAIVCPAAAYPAAMAAAGELLASVSLPDPPLNIVHLTGKTPFDPYFQSIKPFYPRQKYFGLV